MNLLRCAARICILWLLCYPVNAQETISFGLSGSYNFPLGTIGIGTRANIPLNRLLSVSPQIRYAPPFNDFHEFSAGANLHFYFIGHSEQKRYASDSPQAAVYLIGGIHYNRWINYTVSANTLAKTNNILPETGLGFVFGGPRLKVFLEGKYNPLWLEPSAEAGLLFYPFNHSGRRLKCSY